MELYRYNSKKEYVNHQLRATHKKRDLVFVREETMVIITQFLQTVFGSRRLSGLCHGVRKGWEVERFSKLLGADIIGTELAPELAKPPHVICWDFHKAKPEWLEAFDFIYCNSLDHSYKPEACVKTWLSCLKPEGFCFVEWTKNHTKLHKCGPRDCFRASFEECRDLLMRCGTLKATLSVPIREDSVLFPIYIYVLQKK